MTLLLIVEQLIYLTISTSLVFGTSYFYYFYFIIGPRKVLKKSAGWKIQDNYEGMTECEWHFVIYEQAKVDVLKLWIF